MMMKKIALMVAVLAAFVWSQAQTGDWEWIQEVSHVAATVHLLENKETWVIIPDNNPNMRYISQQLPEEYKKDGLAVTFNGWLGKIPPNVRMLGTPLKLTKIWVTCREKKKHHLQHKRYTFQ